MLEFFKAKTRELLKENPSWDGTLKNEQTIKEIVAWLFHGRKKSLILMGGIGCGKTILAKALGRTLAIKNLCPYFYDMKRLVKETKDAEEMPEYVYSRNRAVILDDIGTEPNEVKIFGNSYPLINEIINARYQHFLPTIITTNFNTEFLTEKYGERIMSRLAEMCDKIVMVGEDLRRAR